jgi:FAD/FMN-containing dehydrogenase
MRRRELLAALAAPTLVVPLLDRLAAVAAMPPRRGLSRVRPGDLDWPSPTEWDGLRQRVGGRLIAVQSPLQPCREAPIGEACRTLFRELKNPYYISDEDGLTQTTGWVDAWTLEQSAFAVAAESAADVVAAVDFAREHNLRLVVRGGGHSYLGTSNSRDSLLIWTRRMAGIELHDAFVPVGSKVAPLPAVTVGPGAVWGHVYNAVTTKGARLVQGGGCLTVGVAGLVLGGGFGSYSRLCGTAAASLLEAEIVTADGAVRIANAATNPDLFWALKGGGGGTFGVVTRLTLRTHELPAMAGLVNAAIHAHSDAAFRRLIGRFVAFYVERLATPHWTDIVTIGRNNRLNISMGCLGLDQAQANAIWQPFFAWVAAAGDDYSFIQPLRVFAGSARHRWDPDFLRSRFPGAVQTDDRPGAARDNIYWTANVAEAGHYIFGYESVWLPAALLAADRQDALADALVATSRIWPMELHFQKALASAPPDAVAATRDTATNPAVLDAFVLVIIGSEGAPAYPGLPGYSPDLANARHDAAEVAKAMAELRKLVPEPGSYLAETSYFERDWQKSFWGSNYPRLRRIKDKYDPDGLFFVHHGVGSEDWSADGFEKLSAK